jgi:hypothetical protein
MKEVIVVVHATERKFLMDEYQSQVIDAGIDFHVEPVDLPRGIATMTMRWRLDYWTRMCRKFDDYQRIVFTDAWDVLFYHDPTVNMADKIPNMMMSAERNCWPDDSLSDLSPFSSPWRYPNPGMMAGRPEFIVYFCEHLYTMEGLDEMDQLWCNRHPDILPLDFLTKLFYVASADKEDGSLTEIHGHPFNLHFQTYPSFIHFAGPCHPDPFRAMLRGEVPSLK